MLGCIVMPCVGRHVACDLLKVKVAYLWQARSRTARLGMESRPEG
jgi:hypothetical protein